MLLRVPLRVGDPDTSPIKPISGSSTANARDRAPPSRPVNARRSKVDLQHPIRCRSVCHRGAVTLLALFAGLALFLIGLAALPFVSRRLRRPVNETDPAAAARGRRVRGGILIGIFLLGYPVGGLIERAKARDSEKADRKAEELAAAVVALAEGDPSRFIREATSPDFEGRRVLVEEMHLRTATGDGISSATTSHQVEVGRATRCVRVRVQRDFPPSYEVAQRRC